MSKVILAEYLFTRLKQCGLKFMFGVPGDYNLQLLDHVEPQGLKWVGNCNELNSGYAADGYARVAGIGSLITTFGVGELSAINAIAGAYAEKVCVVHIVGTPPRKTRTDKLFVHHTLGDGDYFHFAKMYEHITVAQAGLWDNETAPEMIDAALQKCLEQHRPVYISVPDDMVNELVASERLSTPIKLETVTGQVPQVLSEKVYNSQRPVILVDGECFGVDKDVNKLAKITGWPTFVSAFGKGLVDESLPNFLGVWGPETERYWKDCDLILCFGPHWSGTNTHMFTTIPDQNITICLTSTGVRFKDQNWTCSFTSVLKTLLGLDIEKLAKPTQISRTLQKPQPQGKLITQADFYRFLSCSGLFKPNDIIMAETGTAGIGAREFTLPENVLLFGPVTWLSIGYMLPAALGTSLARSTRTILLIGDGSFQMTAQELSTIIKQKLNFLLILVNNDGYTIERCIHGKDQSYNDVARWNYLQAPDFFGGGSDDYRIRTASARTWKELEDVLEREKASEAPCLSMIEVFTTKEDAPRFLLGLLEKQYPDGLPSGFPHMEAA